MIELKGKISISRRTSMALEDCVVIEIEDDNSGMEAIEITLSLKNYGKVITNMSYIPCNFKFNNTGIIGKTREQKTVKVLIMEGYASATNPQIAAHMVNDDTVNELFLAGWKPRYDNFRNPKKRTDDGHVMVLFERWV